MRIAIMQPYFIPYAGYFRLFCASDLFVIFDCVQFVRRGWVHRNRLQNINGELQWLTLPLKKAPQTIQIKNLDFANDSKEEWLERLGSFSHTLSSENPLLPIVKELTGSPLEYICNGLQKTCEILNLPFNVVYSSSLNLPESLKGQEKIIEIAKHFGATDYINLAGGRELYDEDSFKHHGLKLKFLSDYQGLFDSILTRFSKETIAELRNDIFKQSQI